MEARALEGGFADPAIGAALAFRSVLDAMSRPGSIHAVTGANPPAPLGVAAGAVALTLCDHDTPVWLAPSLATREVLDWFAFHTGAPMAARGKARFAFGTWTDTDPVTDFAIGSPEYPDRSATLVIEVPEFGDAYLLTGPGIRNKAQMTVPDPAAFQMNQALFPLGWDAILTCGDRLAGLPRTTIVEG
ncbi:MAG: phosphonate C-P lyase system protein PhnH [Pseudomonadota bacterium]